MSLSETVAGSADGRYGRFESRNVPNYQVAGIRELPNRDSESAKIVRGWSNWPSVAGRN